MKNEAQRTPLGRALNSPFCLTLVGGVFVSVMTMVWQTRTAEAAERRDVLLQQMRRRTDVLSDFSQRGGLSLLHAIEFRRRQIWINARKNRLPNVPDQYLNDDSASQTIQRYADSKSEFFKLGNAESLCASVLAEFRSSGVRELARIHRSVINEFLWSKRGETWQESDNECVQVYRQMNDSYDRLVDAMIEEVSADQLRVSAGEL